MVIINREMVYSCTKQARKEAPDFYDQSGLQNKLFHELPTRNNVTKLNPMVRLNQVSCPLEIASLC